MTYAAFKSDLRRTQPLNWDTAHFWSLLPETGKLSALLKVHVSWHWEVKQHTWTKRQNKETWSHNALTFEHCAPILEDRPFTWIVNSGLNDVIHGKSAGGLFVPKVCVHLQRQHLRHVVVVLAEVGILLLGGVVHFQLIVSVSERHDCVYLVQIFGNKDVKGEFKSDSNRRTKPAPQLH